MIKKRDEQIKNLSSAGHSEAVSDEVWKEPFNRSMLCILIQYTKIVLGIFFCWCIPILKGMNDAEFHTWSFYNRLKCFTTIFCSFLNAHNILCSKESTKWYMYNQNWVSLLELTRYMYMYYFSQWSAPLL